MHAKQHDLGGAAFDDGGAGTVGSDDPTASSLVDLADIDAGAASMFDRAEPAQYEQQPAQQQQQQGIYAAGQPVAQQQPRRAAPGGARP